MILNYGPRKKTDLKEFSGAATRLSNKARCTIFCGKSRCKDYDNRAATVPDCIQLTPSEVRTLTWLPPTCAYRLVRDGEDLYWWHPLVSGDPDTVHQAGISVQGRTVSEEGMALEDYEHHVVSWPGEVPQTGD